MKLFASNRIVNKTYMRAKWEPNGDVHFLARPQKPNGDVHFLARPQTVPITFKALHIIGSSQYSFSDV
ncbi:MAG: hypothetical protein II998_00220 [Clostridia bacterium]|nr:hypothetical protein [Clostridia bacterium]